MILRLEIALQKTLLERYFDHAATTSVDDEVLNAYKEFNRRIGVLDE